MSILIYPKPGYRNVINLLLEGVEKKIIISFCYIFSPKRVEGDNGKIYRGVSTFNILLKSNRRNEGNQSHQDYMREIN